MEVFLTHFMFWISIPYVLVQIIIFIYEKKHTLWKYLSWKNFASGKVQSFISVYFIYNTITFLLYNVICFFVTFPSQYIKFRSSNMTLNDKYLTIIEIIIESQTKSLIFSSLALFLPIIKIYTKSYADNYNPKAEIRFILGYSALRTIFYPGIFAIFFKYPMLGLYFIEIINISESFVLMFIYLSVDITYERNKRFLLGARDKQYMKTLCSRYQSTTYIFILQMCTEILYRIILIWFTLSQGNIMGKILLKIGFLLRLISFSLMCRVFSRLLEDDEKKYPVDIFWMPECNEDLIFDDYINNEIYLDKIEIIDDYVEDLRHKEDAPAR